MRVVPELFSCRPAAAGAYTVDQYWATCNRCNRQACGCEHGRACKALRERTLLHSVEGSGSRLHMDHRTCDGTGIEDVCPSNSIREHLQHFRRFRRTRCHCCSARWPPSPGVRTVTFGSFACCLPNDVYAQVNTARTPTCKNF